MGSRHGFHYAQLRIRILMFDGVTVCFDKLYLEPGLIGHHAWSMVLARIQGRGALPYGTHSRLLLFSPSFVSPTRIANFPSLRNPFHSKTTFQDQNILYTFITLLPLLLSFPRLIHATVLLNDDDNDRHACLTDSQVQIILCCVNVALMVVLLYAYSSPMGGIDIIDSTMKAFRSDAIGAGLVDPVFDEEHVMKGGWRIAVLGKTYLKMTVVWRERLFWGCWGSVRLKRLLHSIIKSGRS